jgi:pilus assembly protein CpaE
MLKLATASVAEPSISATPGARNTSSPGTRSILLSSRNRAGLDRLIDAVQSVPDVDIRTNTLSNDHSDPLQGIEHMPDVLLVWIGEQWREELQALVQRPASQRPVLIVVADTGEHEAMRMAMKAGAVDYLNADFDPSELRSSIVDLFQSSDHSAVETRGSVVSVINAKGGSGGSFIACNLAHTLCAGLGQQVALIDLDIQFGSLCHYLDMEPRYGIIEVLQNAYDLDELALKGYMLKHASGMYLLEAKPDDTLQPETVGQEQVNSLLDLMTGCLNHIVVDVPWRTDRLTQTVLQRSDKIILVVQQNLAQLRNARRLLALLPTSMGISLAAIEVVINRYDKRSELTISDISKALGHPVKHTIPNAFAQVNTAINEGIPLAQVNKKFSVTRAFRDICEELVDPAVLDSGTPGLVGRMLKSLKT